LNGQLIKTHAEGLVQRIETAADLPDELPREVRLELNTNRATAPIFWPGRQLNIDRPPLDLATAKTLLSQIASADDVRLTLAGVGDPLLANHVFDVIDLAKTEGIESISMETDFCDLSPETIERLASSAIDVVSIHLPAMTAKTYGDLMGVDAYVRVLQNIRAFVERRQQQGRLVPLVAPVFTKCQANLGEMEAWYDQWLRAVGSAVIQGPSDFAGQIGDVSVADMSPPRRGACVRLASRMNVLCDGTIVACEQDVLGRHVLGEIGRESVRDIWRRIGEMRDAHRSGEWNRFPLCGACREWHRP
jgi:spiro-SPASM protein